VRWEILSLASQVSWCYALALVATGVSARQEAARQDGGTLLAQNRPHYSNADRIRVRDDI